MPFFERNDPEAQVIDLHTLSPEQILPKNVRGDEVEKHLPLEGGVVKVRKMAPNPNYAAHRERFTHHPGAIETYDPQKLGRFHIIVSSSGGTHYTRQPEEVFEKTAHLLEPGGIAFLDVNPDYRHRLDDLQLSLGKNFIVARGKIHFIIRRLK